jgi:hypothetical protein
MLGRLLDALKKPAARPAAAPSAPDMRTAQTLAALAGFEQQYAALHGPAQAPDASAATLQAYAHACYGLETPAHDAECEHALKRLLALEPDNPQAHYALALLISADARFAEAETHLRAAYARAPDNADVALSLTMCLLQRDNYVEGFRLFETRRAHSTHPAPHIAALPAWHGEALAGKTIVLWADWGGFGDDLAYLRYARVIRETLQPARLVVAARAPLKRLLAAQSYIDEAVDLGARVAGDWQCPLIDAVAVVGSNIANLPAWPAYLATPADELPYWRERLAGARGLKVGLVWTSTSVPQVELDLVGRYDKHLANAALASLAGIAGMTYVSLQKGAGIPRAAALLPGTPVLDHTDDLGDFADTAALISQLDLVLTIDTSIAHLAGALGVPALVLLKKSTACFWPIGRDTTPWYPSVRMLVQPALRDWTSVLARARAILERRAAGVPWPQCCDAP